MSIAWAKTETSVKTEHGSAKKIQDLAKIKCIGPEFATTPVGEVFYRSFDNCKQLASYAGLTWHIFRAARCAVIRGSARLATLRLARS
jgi:hypothetical protein